MNGLKILFGIFCGILLLIGIIVGALFLSLLIKWAIASFTSINIGESIRQTLSCSVKSMLGGEC